MKKIFSLLLAFIIFFGLTAFAEEPALDLVHNLGDFEIVAEKYRVAVPHEYNGPVYSYKNYGVKDKNGNYIVEPLYDTIFPPGEGRSAFILDGKIGFFDENWKVLIEAKYESNHYPIESKVVFSEGLAAVGKRNDTSPYGISWGYIDRDGNEVIDFCYDEANPFENGFAVVGIKEEIYNRETKIKYGKIDKEGNVTETFKFGYVYGGEYEYLWHEPIDVILSENLVEINGTLYKNSEIEYPFINYLGYSYIPLTYYGCRMMGINCDWTKEDGVILSSGGEASKNILGESGMESGAYHRAEFYKGKLTVNGKLYEYGDTAYPLIHYKNVVYMPVLWKKGMEELGIDYSYFRDDSKGENETGCMVFKTK